MDEQIDPHEHKYDEFVTDQSNFWQVPPFVADLKAKAREQGADRKFKEPFSTLGHA